jgi:hypothetical protein
VRENMNQSLPPPAHDLCPAEFAASENCYGTAQVKPSAGMKWTEGS